jgi:uncharacterized protein
MRLSRNEIDIIKKSILSEDKDAEIYLFGSRVDDNKKGGDIDILIISDKLVFSDIIFIKRKIFEELEEQKIDIVISGNLEKPFINVAYKNGIRL